MTNGERFKDLFGLYATEVWAMPEKNFLEWLNTPTTAAEPTKHGRWIVISEYPKKAECSYCGYPIEHELVCWWDYCPNCGALMDGKDGGENG